MASPLAPGEAPAAPLRGELRYSLELARLFADRDFRSPARRPNQPPVLLIPGFMAGDQSLAVMSGWLRRRGSRTSRAGVLLNVDCAERAVTAIEARLRRFAEEGHSRVVVIGQSRGGELARVVAVRNPELVGGVIMLGSPVLSPLSVAPTVLNAVRAVARLGDFGVPGMFSRECGDGVCCGTFRDDVLAPLPAGVRGTAVYSRSDGIVAWEACLDESSEHVEVDSSHTGMSVNPRVYDVVARVLDEEADVWTG